MDADADADADALDRVSRSTSASELSNSAYASVADELEFAPKAELRRGRGASDAREGNCRAGVWSLARGWSLVLCCSGPRARRKDGEGC